MTDHSSPANAGSSLYSYPNDEYDIAIEEVSALRASLSTAQCYVAHLEGEVKKARSVIRAKQMPEPFAWRWKYEGDKAWMLRRTKPRHADDGDVICEPLYALTSPAGCLGPDALETAKVANEVLVGHMHHWMDRAIKAEATIQPQRMPIDAILAAVSKVVSSRDDLGQTHFEEIRDAILSALSRPECGDGQ